MVQILNFEKENCKMTCSTDKFHYKELRLNTFRFVLFRDNSLEVFSKDFRIGAFYYCNFTRDFFKFKTIQKAKGLLFPKQNNQTFSLDFITKELQDFSLFCDYYNGFYILQVVIEDLDLCLIQVNQASPLNQTKWLIGGYNNHITPIMRENGISKKRGLIIYDYRELSFILGIIRNKERLSWFS